MAQQDPECAVIPGQRCQVQGGPSVPVPPGGVCSGPEENIHHLNLPGAHRQMERSLQRERDGGQGQEGRQGHVGNYRVDTEQLAVLSRCERKKDEYLAEVVELVKDFVLLDGEECMNQLLGHS